MGDWVLEDADFSASDAEIPYEITGLGAQASPFSIICFLDDDESGGRPDENDMRIRPRIEQVMDQGGNYTQNIEFNGYGTPPGGGDDDDSTGDDDDSTGDDDDSTGDDDDSTGDDDSAAGDDDSAAGDDDDSGGR